MTLGARKITDLPLKMKPSDYWRRQCKATFQFDTIGAKLIDDMGIESLMWGSDYPHTDSTWPCSDAVLDEMFEHFPGDARRKITQDNVKTLYGL